MDNSQKSVIGQACWMVWLGELAELIAMGVVQMNSQLSEGCVATNFAEVVV